MGGEENYAPTFYKMFMSCIHSAVESSTSSSSSAVSSSDQDEEMKMFRRVYSLDDRFGNGWRVLLVPQNVFMNMKFRCNPMGKLKNSFMFAEFFDELVESVFRDTNIVGKKIWQEMNTQRQVKNLMYVCRLLTVAKYCKKEKELEKDVNFITAMSAIYQWFQDKQYSEMMGANCVKVTENLLTVFDARGTSTRCISKKYVMENTYDLAADMLQKDDSFESNENNLLDVELEKLAEEEEEGGALAGTGGTGQKGDDSAGVCGKVAEETNVGQKRKKSVP
eukprot:scaffold28951_cov55-Attheya_sp.AAC.1